MNEVGKVKIVYWEDGRISNDEFKAMMRTGTDWRKESHGSQLMELQLLQLELRLGKNHSRSFRPLKSAENSWQIWISCSLRVPFALDWSWGMMRFLALGWHLDGIHVTWAHLEKKWTRLRTYTKSLEELYIQRVETASQA
ncbi:hypothetical protein Tco_0753556 [Tanacetum coccineum]